MEMTLRELMDEFERIEKELFAIAQKSDGRDFEREAKLKACRLELSEEIGRRTTNTAH